MRWMISWGTDLSPSHSPRSRRLSMCVETAWGVRLRWRWGRGEARGVCIEDLRRECGGWMVSWARTRHCRGPTTRKAEWKCARVGWCG